MPPIQHNQNKETILNILTTSTPQSIIVIIIQGLTSYYNGRDTKYILQFNNNDSSITQHQNNIDWDNFTRGRISKTFQRVITSYYKQKKMKQLPTLWTSIVVGNIIDIHLDAWKDRCQDIHGIHIGNKEYSSNKDDLLAIVKVYYEQSYLLSYQDKNWWMNFSFTVVLCRPSFFIRLLCIFHSISLNVFSLQLYLFFIYCLAW